MVRTQIQLTEPQAVALREQAHRSGRSMAELIRCAVDRFLCSPEGGDSIDRKRRSLAAVGSLHSGLDNLAEEHDRYLAEAYR